MFPLPARFAPLVQGFFLTLFMTCIVSGISTLWALGPSAEFLARWPAAWMMSWAIAFPAVLVVMPLVRRITQRLVARS
ncbi:MAG: DUF2798 domain-containing protein [Roseococcus sp.]|nr:DUF2798 domain-containing protein [Roseococcus sp.]